MSVFTALNKLKTNIFGGPGNTGFTKPPASRVQDIGIQPSPTGLLDYDPLSLATFSYPLDVIMSRQIAQNISISQAFKQGALWRGYSICAFRAVLVNSINFSIYEFVMKSL